MTTVLKSHRVSRRRKHSTHPLGRLLEYGHQYRKQIWLATTYSILNKFKAHIPQVHRIKKYLSTSAVDNETKAAIERSLERITLDRTTIAIA